jgi:galactose oxidase
MRLASVTHAFDQNTRRLRLTFSADATGLTVTAPTTGNIAPPGHYMLFIVNGSDVPSVAAIVKLN